MCKILEYFGAAHLNMYFLIYIYRGIDGPNHKVQSMSKAYLLDFCLQGWCV